MKNTLKKIGTGLLTTGALAGAAMAQSSSVPLDLTSAASSIAGYVPVAAALGAAVFAAIYGVRIIIKSFKAVAK